MPRRILKWNVPVDDTSHPVGAGPVVLVGCQGDIETVQVWTEEYDSVDPRMEQARVYGTGQPLPDDHADGEHVGSVAVAGGHLVWHVFRSRRA